MTALVLVIGVVVMCLLPLAGIGAWAVYGQRELERQRIARIARDAERQVVDIGRHAQAMILAEALRRAQRRPNDQP